MNKMRKVLLRAVLGSGVVRRMSDAQLEAFTRYVGMRYGWKKLVMLLMVMAGIVVIWGEGVPWAIGRFGVSRAQGWKVPLELAADVWVIVLLVVPAAMGLLLRDRLVRKAEVLMREHKACPKCGYSLQGLEGRSAGGMGGVCVCPECGSGVVLGWKEEVSTQRAQRDDTKESEQERH